VGRRAQGHEATKLTPSETDNTQPSPQQSTGGSFIPTPFMILHLPLRKDDDRVDVWFSEEKDELTIDCGK
jgi:hypothetical protein